MANGYLSAGQVDEAAESYLQAILLLQTLTHEMPTNLHLRESLARSEANMAIVEYSNRDLPAAAKRFETAASLYSDLARDNPRVVAYHQTLAKTRQNLGMVYQALGQIDDAIEQQRLASQATDDPETVAMSLNNLGAIHFRREEYVEAASYFEQMSELLETVVANLPEDVDAKNKLAAAYNNTASVFRAIDGRHADAEKYYKKSIEIRRGIIEGAPIPEYFRGLAEAVNNLAQLHVKIELFDQAEPFFDEAIEIWQSVCAAADIADNHASLGETFVNFSRCLAGKAEYEAALRQLHNATEEINRALELDPDHAGALIAHQTAADLENSVRAKFPEFDKSPTQRDPVKLPADM